MTSRNENGAPFIVRTDLSALLSDYTNSQRRYNNRIESLEREMTSLKGQVNQSFLPNDEHELNRTFTTKKVPMPFKPLSARVMSPSRIPVPITPRKSVNDDKPAVSRNEPSSARSLPMVRSKTFHNSTSRPQPPSPPSPPSQVPTTTDNANLLRVYKLHLEQTFHKNAPPFCNTKVPNYTSVEDVIIANEQLLLENDRLRSELNRLKTESIILLRSMKTTGGGVESNLGNERITAERERQELTMELARQIEENKRLRKALLAQSTKFLTLRQSTDIPSVDHLLTPTSSPQTVPNSSRIPKCKSARYNTINRGFVRPKTFYSTNDPM